MVTLRLPSDITSYGTGRVIGDVGMPGSGKTQDIMQMALLGEKPFWLIDTVGAASRALEGKDCLIAAIKPGDVDIHDLWEWTTKELQRIRRVVWDLGAWTPQEMQELIEAMMPRIRTLKDITVGVDEIQRIVPDFSADLGRGSPGFKDWATKRRNDGVDIFWSSQRPAFVSMTIRGITDFWIIHRLFEPADTEVIRKKLSGIPDIDPDAHVRLVPTLGPGQVMTIDLPFQT